MKYVGFDTQSDENSITFPSTDKQLILLRALKEEMEAMGMTEVTIDEHGYVMGSIEASEGYEHCPVIGLLSHVDTSPDMSGAAIKPQIIRNYNGEDIALNEEVTMKVSDFPELN